MYVDWRELKFSIHPETKMASYQDAVAPHKDWPVSVILIPSFAATATDAS